MPARIKQQAQQLALMKLFVDMTNGAAAICLARKTMGADSDVVLLCIAIGIGQLEGRPMSVSQLSQYIGMPRATTARKLSELLKRGLVERLTQRIYRLPPDNLNRPEVMQAVAALTRKLHRTSTELLNMGS